MTELRNKVNDERFLNCLTLKELVVYPTTKLESKYTIYKEQYTTINTKPLSQIINEFVEAELYEKRNTLIMLLLNSTEPDGHYLAYLLYDLLSNDMNGIIDTQEQTIMCDSFPWSIKQYFKDAMKRTVQYTNELSNFDIQKIPLEQQICLLKVK